MLLGTLKAPSQKLVSTLAAVPSKLVRTLAAVRDQKQAAAAALKESCLEFNLGDPTWLSAKTKSSMQSRKCP